MDIWYKGENVFFDPGTYKYNTEDKYLKFYHGTKGHNTVSLGDLDQMKKGDRFIWYYWTSSFDENIMETNETFEFQSKIRAFRQLNSEVIHFRKVVKFKGMNKWKIIDSIDYKGDLFVIQHWNIKNNDFFEKKGESQEINFKVLVDSYDKDGKALRGEYVKGWNSDVYGVKNEFDQLIFKTKQNYIETDIEIIDIQI